MRACLISLLFLFSCANRPKQETTPTQQEPAQKKQSTDPRRARTTPYRTTTGIEAPALFYVIDACFTYTGERFIDTVVMQLKRDLKEQFKEMYEPIFVEYDEVGAAVMELVFTEETSGVK